jgi:hypothetical protein
MNPYQPNQVGQALWQMIAESLDDQALDEAIDKVLEEESYQFFQVLQAEKEKRMNAKKEI